MTLVIFSNTSQTKIRISTPNYKEMEVTELNIENIIAGSECFVTLSSSGTCI
jgi:hypothetical protein